ncbi:MAG: DUF4861 domain-containing protein [Bacteroides sp.]|nr:DUF4861 domain-containing protein [Bacteroides sp.]
MKTHIFAIIVAAILFGACSGPDRSLEISVKNPLDLERVDEMIEISMDQVASQLSLDDADQVFILNEQGTEVPYQITYDKKLIFPASVAPLAESKYVVKVGEPTNVPVKVCGKVYPERMDDLAWENDLVGFRAYGPTLQSKGERGFGYDLFVKRGTTEPVLEKMYAMETDQATWAQINELKKTDPAAAEELRRSITYHVDKGYGMDCYAVGPTLGGGVAALLENDEIVYPWCYKDYEILDNGPLRFTAKLVFTPLSVKGKDNVIETRVITLDLNSHLNRTAVSYTQLEESMPIVTGIVMHNTDGAVVTDAEKGYMTYVDPTTGPDQGRIFMGAAFPNEVKEAKTSLFSDAEKKQRNNACGHVLAVSEYNPEAEYVYYWGFAWDRADIQTPEAWNAYMLNFAQKVRNPLTVSVK